MHNTGIIIDYSHHYMVGAFSLPFFFVVVDRTIPTLVTLIVLLSAIVSGEELVP